MATRMHLSEKAPRQWSAMARLEASIELDRRLREPGARRPRRGGRSTARTAWRG